MSTTSVAANITVNPAQAKGVFYILPDHLGTPRAVTDESNKIVWKNDPLGEPFGADAPDEDPDGDGQKFTLNLRFPGQYFDQETGTSYNYFRDYDPATGRYVESDPIGLDGGTNSYGYVESRPMNMIDPEGFSGRAPGKPGPHYPNGNYNPGFTPQDGVCSVPGWAGQKMNSNSCVLSCCKAHDQCYAQHGCNASSWSGNAQGQSLACQQCNATAARCVVNAYKNGCPSCSQ